ncbi:MAG: hypothetical protein ACJAS4_000945 [Bacteriovoracaceae bacterium]|jgi:hypothetical protein
MLRSSLKILFITLFLFPLSGSAYFNKAQKSELNRKIFKTEQHLKSVITKDLKSAIGVKELLVDVQIDVNKTRIYNEVASIDEKWKEIEKLQLPSLFIDANQQNKLKEVKSITVENVLSHIRTMKLTISSPYDIVDQVKMKEKIKTILASNYSRAKEIKIEITFSKTQDFLVDNRASSLTTPNYTHVVSDLKKLSPYVFGGIGIIFLGFLMFLWMFKRSMHKMTNALDDIEVSGNLTASIAQPKSKELTLDKGRMNQELQDRSSNGKEDISSYIELVDRIRYLVKKNKELVMEMITLHFHIGEVHKIMILLNILEPIEREELYTLLSARHIKDLKNFVVNDGDILYQDEKKLNEIAREIFRVISIANVKPESFYQIYLKKIILSLSAAEVVSVIRACTSKELMYFLENVDGVKLAFVSATHDLSDIEFHEQSEELTTEETKNFVHKLAKFIYAKDALIDGNSKANLIPHLSHAMEAKYIEKMGISTELSFKNLVGSNIEYVQEYIKELEFDDINDILALFNEEEQKSIISVMPEIVAERLSSRSFKLSENSFVLKIDLYERIKTLHLKKQKENVELLNSQINLIDEEYSKIEQQAAITDGLEAENKNDIVIDSDKAEDDEVA